VTATGALPLHAGQTPGSVRDLLVQVKTYERLTVRAALARDRQLAVEALASNPLIASADLARTLVAAMVDL
jgi:6-phospho-beta-glucosidase